MDMSNKSDAVLGRYARSDKATPEELKKLSTHENRLVRRNVAKNPNTHSSVILQLVDDPEIIVAANAYTHPNLTEAGFAKLRNDKRTSLMKKIIRIHGVNKYVFEALLSHKSYSVRKIVVSTTRMTPELLHRIAVKETASTVVEKIVQHVHVSAETLEYIYNKNKESTVRASIAMNPTTPVHIIETLLHDNDEHIVLNALKSPKVTPEMLYSVVEETTNRLVMIDIAKLPSLPEDLHFKLMEKASNVNNKFFYSNMLSALAYNPKVSATVIEKIYKTSQELLTIKSIASNPSTPAHVLEDINKNYKGFNLEQVVAGNWNTPAKTLEQLFASTFFFGLSINWSTPLPVLYELSTNENGDLDHIKEEVVYQIWCKDPVFMDWSQDWVEAHFGVKNLNKQYNKFLILGKKYSWFDLSVLKGG